MAHRDDFTIQFHHGGNMVNDGGLQIYIGGDKTFKSHFDADKFGYFDLIDEIKQLGYAKCSRLAFTVPNSIKKIDIKDDKDVMLMLSYLELGICVLDVYVVGGELGEAHVEEVEGSVGGEHGDEGVNEIQVDEVEGNVGEEYGDEGVDETEVEYHGGDEDDSEDGDGLGEDESEGEDDGPNLEKGEADGNEQYEDLDEFGDGSYIPSTDREDDTDYSSLDGFFSDDDEYIQARDKFKKSNLRVITDDLFNGIVPNVGVNKTTEGCGDSDYVDSDGDFVSDSTDEEDDRSRIKERHRRRVYDPRCDHKSLKFTPGMRFKDGFQVRDVVTNNAIENGWEIRFKRASKTQVEAKCKKPCKWRCYGSFSSAVGAFLLSRVE